MDTFKLFRIVRNFATKNNLTKIPVPQKPFNSINEKKFIKSVENFLLNPEFSHMVKSNQYVKNINFKEIEKLIK